MSSGRKAIGRGLGAILGEVESAYENSMSDDSGLVQEIAIREITPNPLQPRKQFLEESLKELADSIKTYGLLQPIIVYEDNDRYVLIAGERRLRASKIAGFEYIKAIVADIDQKRLRELALIENIQREDLNPLDLAESFKELIDNYDITHEELSSIIHKSRTHITNTLRVLNLEGSLKEALRDRRITLGHAKILAGLDKDSQKVVANSIIGQKLSVRDTEELVKKYKEKDNKQSKKSAIDRLDFSVLKNGIKEFCSENVTISSKQNSVTLGFKTQEDVDNFTKSLKIGKKF